MGEVSSPTTELDDLRSKSDEAATKYLHHSGNVGLVVGVLRGGERKVFSYGKTARVGGSAPDEQTIFEIGSATKVFTANRLADAVQRGEVKLDDPVRLPEPVRTPSRNGRAITFRHLATHTSGLPRLPGNLFSTVKDVDNPYADYTVEDLHRFLGQCELKRDPGVGYEYSNLGGGLLGHALEHAAQRDYETAVRERISEPLGMVDTRIHLDDAQKPRFARGHSEQGKPVSNWDFPALPGGGALRSTAKDLLAYLAANLGEATGSLKETLERCHEPGAMATPFISSARRYGVAFLVAALALLIQLGIGLPKPASAGELLLLALPIIIAGGYAGLRAGLLTVLLLVLGRLALRFFPAQSLAPGVLQEVAVMAVIGMLIAWFASSGHRSSPKTQIGLGWHLTPMDRRGRKMIWHNGGTGGFSSWMGFVKETRTGVVVLSNSANSVDDIGVRLLKALQQE